MLSKAYIFDQMNIYTTEKSAFTYKIMLENTLLKYIF